MQSSSVVDRKPAAINAMTLPELKQLCKDCGIKGVSAMNKTDLLAHIIKAESIKRGVQKPSAEKKAAGKAAGNGKAAGKAAGKTAGKSDAQPNVIVSNGVVYQASGVVQTKEVTKQKNDIAAIGAASRKKKAAQKKLETAMKAVEDAYKELEEAEKEMAVAKDKRIEVKTMQEVFVSFNSGKPNGKPISLKKGK